MIALPASISGAFFFIVTSLESALDMKKTVACLTGTVNCTTKTAGICYESDQWLRVKIRRACHLMPIRRRNREAREEVHHDLQDPQLKVSDDMAS